MQCDNECQAYDGETGVGWDYTAFVPIWCNPAHRATTISLDFGITYIGHNALGGFAFIGSDGSVLEPIAENLSGHTFNGVDGVLHQIDCLKTSCDPYINLCSVVELVSARN